MRFFEDIAVGEKRALGRHTFAVEEIKAFARRFDPQPFHVDDAAATSSHFGALVASGWHTAAVCIRLIVQHRMREEEAMRGRGEPVGRTGPSPGFREMKWLRPVHSGDTISYASEIVDKRTVQSVAGKGLVFARNTGTNQDEALVFSFVSSVFVDCRPV